MQNSEIGNGQKNTVLSGLLGLFRSLGGKKNQEKQPLKVDNLNGLWFIMDGDDIFAGPYKTEGAAKGQLTRFLKGYTPASRRPVQEI